MIHDRLLCLDIETVRMRICFPPTGRPRSSSRPDWHVQAHGVEIRPPCVNASRWDCSLESTEDDSGFTVRLGLCMVKGLANPQAAILITARADRPFASVVDLWRRMRVPQAALVSWPRPRPMPFRQAFDLARREALWVIRALHEPLPLFAAASDRQAEIVPEVGEPVVALRPMTASGEVIADYRHVGLTLRSHPVSFLRAEPQARRIASCAVAMAARDCRWLKAAGLVLVR